MVLCGSVINKVQAGDFLRANVFSAAHLGSDLICSPAKNNRKRLIKVPRKTIGLVGNVVKSLTLRWCQVYLNDGDLNTRGTVRNSRRREERRASPSQNWRIMMKFGPENTPAGRRVCVCPSLPMHQMVEGTRGINRHLEWMGFAAC